LESEFEHLRATAEHERAAYEQLIAERQRLQAQLASQKRALRWSPRHWLGLAARRSETVRRLRSGRGSDG
jgi:hypothetical protein